MCLISRPPPQELLEEQSTPVSCPGTYTKYSVVHTVEYTFPTAVSRTKSKMHLGGVGSSRTKDRIYFVGDNRPKPPPLDDADRVEEVAAPASGEEGGGGGEGEGGGWWWQHRWMGGLWYSQASTGEEKESPPPPPPPEGRRKETGAGAVVLLAGLFIFSLAYYFSKPSLYEIKVIK